MSLTTWNEFMNISVGFVCVPRVMGTYSKSVYTVTSSYPQQHQSPLKWYPPLSIAVVHKHSFVSIFSVHRSRLRWMSSQFPGFRAFFVSCTLELSTVTSIVRRRAVGRIYRVVRMYRWCSVHHTNHLQPNMYWWIIYLCLSYTLFPRWPTDSDRAAPAHRKITAETGVLGFKA